MQKHHSFETSEDVLSGVAPEDLAAAAQRQRIVEGLIESCAEKTYAATTIADIVARAHVSRTTFYKRFHDKRQCFDAAVGDWLGELRDVAEAAHSSADGPADAVRQAATAILAELASHPGVAQLLTGDAVSVDPTIVDRYRRLVLPALRELWTRAGEEPRTDADARTAFGQVQLLIFNQIAAGRPDDLPELLPRIVYLAVAPFGGHEEAVRQSQLAARTAAPGLARA